MSTKRSKSEAAVLEQYRVALENAKNQPTISRIMTEYSYTPEVIAEGENLYSNTLLVYNQNKTEDDETSAAYADFSTKKEELVILYRAHRKRAKTAFRKDPVTLEQLALSGSQPGAYIKWMEMVKKFYTTVSANEAFKNKLRLFKVTEEELAQGQALITAIEAARAEYLREVGESEDITKQKDTAFANLDDWMSDFYAVAEIAIEEQPQLLEALGKSVKS